MDQIIEIYQKFVKLPKITEVAFHVYKTSLGIIFAFFLLPDIPDVIRDKILSVINNNYIQYMEYIEKFTIPLISWLIEINYKLICLIAVLWLVQQIFIQFSITDVIRYPIKILLPSSLIISCAILVAPIFYITLINGLNLSQKIHDIWVFYNTTASWNDLLISCIPFAFASCCFIEILYDESQKEYIEWKNKLP